MSHKRQDYLAYLLRLWRADTKQGPVWRASLDSPHTGERQGFADLAALFAFLQDSTRQESLRSEIEQQDRDIDDGSSPREEEERRHAQVNE